MTPNNSSALVDGLEELNTLLTAQPRATLRFYDFAVILERPTGDGMVSFAVDPQEIASAFASNVSFSTGLLGEDTLYIWQLGIQRLVVEYRKPQITALFVEGAEAPYRIPLPGLILARSTSGKQPTYALFAAKRRPVSLDERLYQAPIPNVGSNGVCWGTVPKPSDQGLLSNHLAEDWRLLLGSPFNNHSVNGKSKTFQKDIRQQYAALEARSAKRYPTTDLVPAGAGKLKNLIEAMQR
jgi:hypothetical protein